MHKIFKHRFFLFAIAAILLIAGFLWQKTQAQEEITRTATVAKESLIESISASGEIAAKNSAHLNFSTPSKITWVGVKKGDQVKKGQTVASLDQRQLEKNLKKKLLAYMSNRWDFEQTHENYDIDGRAINEVTLTDAEKRIVEKAQFSLDSSVLDVEIADLTKKEAYLSSPIAGTVTAVEGMNVGENLTAVTTGSSYIKIVDLNSLYFVASIDEVDYNKISVGQKVQILLDAFPDDSFTGHVSYISKEGTKTLSGGVTIPVEITFDSLPNNLVVGLSGDVDFIISEKENTLVIPKEFLKTVDGREVVSVLENNKPVVQTVETGLKTISQVEIVAGLTEGQEIVLTSNGNK